MRPSFPLFQSHLDLAHSYWQRLVLPGDCVIDATCGAGFDSLALARLALTADIGALHALDIQEPAIAATRARLHESLAPAAFARVHLHQQSHATFPSEIAPGTVRLVVYNLGYLPGTNKALTTQVSSTLESLAVALPLLQPGGCISITAYPGHPEGARERDRLLDYAATLDPMLWSCCQHVWVNRRAAPTLILLQNTKIMHE